MLLFVGKLIADQEEEEEQEVAMVVVEFQEESRAEVDYRGRNYSLFRKKENYDAKLIFSELIIYY